MAQVSWRIARSIRVLIRISVFLTVTSLYSADWTDIPPQLSDFDNPDYHEWLPLAEKNTATAIQLNNLGFQAYLAGHLVEAAKMWKASLQVDPENPWAHYNYASVLAVFAKGFGDFDAPGNSLPRSAWQRDDFWEYRKTIIRHLKISISLMPERLGRVREDSDFDSIRGLPEYINVVMGPHPDVVSILSNAPKWYSLQTGAFLPEDILTFSQNRHVEYEWDASGRLQVFPEIYTEGENESFSGIWRAVGDSIEIETDDGRQFTCQFANTMDEYGFIAKRVLLFNGIEYGDYDAHYWEGQDG